MGKAKRFWTDFVTHSVILMLSLAATWEGCWNLVILEIRIQERHRQSVPELGLWGWGVGQCHQARRNGGGLGGVCPGVKR